MELWSLMHFLMPQIFASHAQFKDWFNNPLVGMVEGQQDVNKVTAKSLSSISISLYMNHDWWLLEQSVLSSQLFAMGTMCQHNCSGTPKQIAEVAAAYLEDCTQ